MYHGRNLTTSTVRSLPLDAPTATKTARHGRRLLYAK